ncbi:MAG: hypothetical protein RLZZ135_2382 [Cyanobacteriota bacterium]|jgi:hypothetical protein
MRSSVGTLAQGANLIDGTQNVVQNDRRVIEAYLMIDRVKQLREIDHSLNKSILSDFEIGEFFICYKYCGFWCVIYTKMV